MRQLHRRTPKSLLIIEGVVCVVNGRVPLLDQLMNGITALAAIGQTVLGRSAPRLPMRVIA